MIQIDIFGIIWQLNPSKHWVKMCSLSPMGLGLFTTEDLQLSLKPLARLMATCKHAAGKTLPSGHCHGMSWDDIWTTERLHWIDLVIWPQQYLIFFSSAFTCIHIIHMCFNMFPLHSEGLVYPGGIWWPWAAAPRSRPRWTDHGYRKCRSASRAHWQSCSAAQECTGHVILDLLWLFCECSTRAFSGLGEEFTLCFFISCISYHPPDGLDV